MKYLLIAFSFVFCFTKSFSQEMIDYKSNSFYQKKYTSAVVVAITKNISRDGHVKYINGTNDSGEIMDTTFKYNIYPVLNISIEPERDNHMKFVEEITDTSKVIFSKPEKFVIAPIPQNGKLYIYTVKDSSLSLIRMPALTNLYLNFLSKKGNGELSIVDLFGNVEYNGGNTAFIYDGLDKFSLYESYSAKRFSLPEYINANFGKVSTYHRLKAVASNAKMWHDNYEVLFDKVEKGEKIDPLERIVIVN